MRSSTTANLALATALALAAPAFAIFVGVPSERVDEVPVDRLLANLQRDTNLDRATRWRAIGRVHLIAYLRQAAILPTYRNQPGVLAEGRIGDCAELDAQAQGRGGPQNFPPAKPGERCEAREYSLGPKPEISQGDRALAAPPNRHLSAAIDAYTRAKSLEPGHLRTRLALAFAFDRAGRKPFARAELRFIAQEGLRRTASLNSGEPMDWEMHVVLSEAVAHFTLIAKSRADKNLIAALKRRLDASPPAMYVTPVLVPLKSRVAFEELTDRASSVKFDFTGQGRAHRLGWINKNAAWLVWDPKNKGHIHSGFQLFGSVTWLAFWDNGYQPLAALDDNGDGKLSGAELKGLALWRDKDGDGVSDPGEVKPVAAHGIVALSYANKHVRDDLWVARKGVTFANGETRSTYDWQLREKLLLSGR